MTTISSGIITRSGDSLVELQGSRARHIEPELQDRVLSYRIVSDDQGLHVDGTKPADIDWPHYRYTFIYRFQGRTVQVGWKCGSGYGEPKPADGLRSAISDAETVAWEAFTQSWMDDFGIEDYREGLRIYTACERMNDRLDRLFGEDRTQWEEAARER